MMTLGVIAIKGAILLAIALLFHIKGRSRILFTLSLAQAGGIRICFERIYSTILRITNRT